MIDKHPFELEKHRLDQYKAFAERYGISDLTTLVELYEIDDLERFLPPQPTPAQKATLNQLIGVRGIESGYMDYTKSQHAFELIMQFQEQTGTHEHNAIFFTKEDH